METLRKEWAFAFSPKFWGVVLTAAAYWVHQYGFIFSPELLSEFVLHVAGGATGIGVLDSAARKASSKKK